MSSTPGQGTPIAIFVYRRPEHTRRCLQSLMQCHGFSSHPLFIYCDGPRGALDKPLVKETRSVVRALVGDSSSIHESSSNKGLANSIISGVTLLCEEYGSVIVIEDDLIFSPDYLDFMSNALEKYAEQDKVMHISGHSPFENLKDSNESAVFVPYPDSWGWATWSRAWAWFDPNATNWEARLSSRKSRRAFDLGGTIPYVRMLKKQMSGNLDSWAVRWHYSMFVFGGLALIPPSSLVRNTGLDGSGTHTSVPSRKAQSNTWGTTQSTFPNTVELNSHSHKVLRAVQRQIWKSRFYKLWKRTLQTPTGLTRIFNNRKGA